MGLDIRREDTVLVTAGKEKGKKGRVLSVMPGSNRVLIERVNIVKRHMKPSKQYSQGGIIDKEAPVHRANVMLVCPKCSSPTRVGNLILGDGRKVRVCKKCKEVMD
jgi:large subunit ribosomal protein L24